MFELGRSVGLLALLGLSTACSELDRSEDTYCRVNPDDPTCLLEQPWACLNDPPQPLPLPMPGSVVAFIQPVLEWGTKQSLAGRGLTASLCPGINSSCSAPLSTQEIIPGMVGPRPLPSTVPAIFSAVAVPEGFDGFIKFEVPRDPATTPDGDRFIPDAYYLAGEISGQVSQGAPILMLQKKLRDIVIQDSFDLENPLVVNNSGIVAFSVYDCQGVPVSGARVQIDMGGSVPPNVVPFQLPASRIPVAQDPNAPLLTSETGSAGYLNVPPGTVRVLAYQDATSQEPFGEIQVGSVAGQITLAPIRPRYVRSADVNRPVDTRLISPTTAP
jgi:hypothetical protein